MVLLSVLQRVVVSGAVLALSEAAEVSPPAGAVEAAGVLVGRAVVVARPALGSKVKMWREVMGDTQKRQELNKAAKAWVRKHNRTMAELRFTAARNGHVAMAHNLAGTILLSRLDADLLRARAACGQASDVA